jgi:hypothetical protein
METVARWNGDNAHCGHEHCGEYLRTLVVSAVTRPGFQIHMHETLRQAGNSRGAYFQVATPRLQREEIGLKALRHRTRGRAITVQPGGPDLRNYRPWGGADVWVRCPSCRRINHVFLPL